MRRSMNGTRNASNMSGSKHGSSSMTTRSVSTDENGLGKGVSVKSVLLGDEIQQGTPGPVTARLKALEKRCSQILEVQAKFNILDKWIQQQFSIKLFPSAVVNMEKFSEGSPEDAENPFYAVYLLCQRVKFLEDKIKKLESRPFEDIGELRPTSNYSSAHAFRNFRGHGRGGGVKRNYGTSSPATTPKKAKLIPRPSPTSSNYPFKPSVKILPKDPNSSPIKKADPVAAAAAEQVEVPAKTTSPTKPTEEPDTKADEKQQPAPSKANDVVDADKPAGINPADIKEEPETEKAAPEGGEKMETDSEVTEIQAENKEQQSKEKDTEEIQTLEPEVPTGSSVPEKVAESGISIPENVQIKEEDIAEEDTSISTKASTPDDIPILEDSTAMADDEMDTEIIQNEALAEMEVEQKVVIPIEEDLGAEDISGSEASVSSMASSSSKPRLSTRRRQAAAAASSSSTSGKQEDEEKPVMYTARGRRHTVPRRYAEFTGHDNVVSILKSQQRAEKAALTAAGGAAGSSKGGKRQQSVTPTKPQDTPPRIKKMVKTAKTPSPKKPSQVDLDFDSDGTGKKKSGSAAASANDRPPCVDALVDRVMAREVDSDGMVVLSEEYPNIFVNQQQLVTVVVRSNGKSTRLTRKMTTLVFEDSVLASASPFGTKYYKDRLPPEPLEAMVDFIADSGFEPHYSKKKIYMIVGQVCNEARAGRVSRKFMQPLEATPGSSSGSQSQEFYEVDEGEGPPSPEPSSQ